MAEEELNYVTVKFNSHNLPNDGVIYEDMRSELEMRPPQHSTQEQSGDVEEIYDDVRSKELPCNLPHIFQENVSKLSLHAPVTLVVAALGILCVILMSVIIALSLNLNSVMAEQRRQSVNLTAHMQAKLELLQERALELSTERNQLNWTVGQVLRFDIFPVNDLCPQKVLSLCKPCADNWLQFGSKCYLFVHAVYYADWKTWQDSVDDCKQRNAKLLLIESWKEQEFVSNHTRYYNDDKHGYWMGLSKNEDSDRWNWNDGRNLTLPFWRNENYYYRNRCALTSKSRASQSLNNWSKANCDMKNRFICQTHAFAKPDLP
ncbi:oxidized low-density lipoprotein receptor 1-like [Festucalex cinctus]